MTDSIKYSQDEFDVISAFKYRCQLAELLQRNGWFEEAEYEYDSLIKEASNNIAFKEHYLNRCTLGLAWTLNQDAVSLILKNELNKAEVQIRKALQLSSQVKTDTQLLAFLYHNLGRIYMLKGDYKQAIMMLNKSVLLQQKYHGNVLNKTQKYINECQKHL